MPDILPVRLQDKLYSGKPEVRIRSLKEFIEAFLKYDMDPADSGDSYTVFTIFLSCDFDEFPGVYRV